VNGLVGGWQKLLDLTFSGKEQSTCSNKSKQKCSKWVGWEKKDAYGRTWIGGLCSNRDGWIDRLQGRQIRYLLIVFVCLMDGCMDVALGATEES
jgi:hypothetical protein